MEPEKFDPHDPQYQNVEDLPQVTHENSTVETSDSDESEKPQSEKDIKEAIDILIAKRQLLSDKRGALKTELDSLIHEYSNAGLDLEKFKEARQVLEARVESPMLPEKLRQNFESVFGFEPIHDMSVFLDRRPRADESKQYRSTGTDLRTSVSTLSETKENINELMQAELSFRGGMKEDETRPPREESIKEVAQTIQNLDIEISTMDSDVARKREEAVEAWKRENPEEWAAIEKKEESAMLFQELIASNPEVNEIVEVFTKTQYPEIKHKAKAWLLSATMRGEGGLGLSVFRIPGFYSTENLGAYRQLFKKKEDGLQRESQTARLVCSELDVHESHPELVDFLISKLEPGNCRHFGHYETCSKEGCFMASNYFDLPVHVQEKLVERLRTNNYLRLADKFAQVRMKDIADPLERAEFVLNLGEPTTNFEYFREYKEADSISSKIRHESAITYLKSGNDNDLKKKALAVSFLGGYSSEDQEVIYAILGSLQSDDEIRNMLGPISRVISIHEDETSLAEKINENALLEYFGRTAKLVPQAKESVVKAAMSSKGAILENLFDWDWARLPLANRVGDIIDKHFAVEIERASDEYQKSVEKKERERADRAEKVNNIG